MLWIPPAGQWLQIPQVPLLLKAVDNLFVLPDFKDDAIQVDNGINGIKWTRLPFNNALNNGIGDT